MKIRGAQWNIQAAKVLNDGGDPLAKGGYEGDNPQYFAGVLAKYKPDFVTLQEVHSNEQRDQAEEVAFGLGFEYVRTDAYEPKSFMDENYSLGQSIISRFPFIKERYTPIEYQRFLFQSPEHPDEKWRSRPNGMTTCQIDIGGRSLGLLTTHLIPFGWLMLDPFSERRPAREIRDKLMDAFDNTKGDWILQGDINVHADRLSTYLPRMLDYKGYSEIIQESFTTPEDNTLDHVAARGVKITKSQVVNSVKADHFLLITDYEI